MNAKGVVKCGLLMFHLGTPALSLFSVSAYTRQQPPYCLVPNEASGFFAPMATDPDKT